MIYGCINKTLIFEPHVPLQADSGIMVDLFPVGNKLEPLIRSMASEELALSRDEMTVFINIDKNGRTSQRHAVTWSDTPIDIGE